MSRRAQAQNAFESNLTNSISGADTTFDLDSTTGLTTSVPGYLVLEDESLTLREYIKFTSITGTTLNGVSRGLDGSVGGAQAHGGGAVVRSVMMSQFIDDIFSDVEDLELADGVNAVNLTTHEGITNPHGPAGFLSQSQADLLYLALTGGTMTGPLSLGTNKITDVVDPSADQDVVTKKFADDTYEAGAGGPFLSLDGVAVMAGDIQMGSNKVTELAAGTAGTNAVNKTQLDGVETKADDAQTAADDAQTDADTGIANAATAQVTADAALPKVGGVGNPMAGNLVMGGFRVASVGDPTAGDDAVPRDFGDARYVQVAGDTMTGLLVLSGGPVADLNPASKGYVDNRQTHFAAMAQSVALTPGLGTHLYTWNTLTEAGTDVGVVQAVTGSNLMRFTVPGSGLTIIAEIAISIGVVGSGNGNNPELLLQRNTNAGGDVEVARTVTARFDSTQATAILTYREHLTTVGTHDFTLEWVLNGSTAGVALVQNNRFEATAFGINV